MPEIEIAAVGDIMLARGVEAAARYTKDVLFPFRETAELLRRADLTIGNLECVLSDRGKAAEKRYNFRADPAAIEALQFAGFDVLSLANNHAMDYGPTALLDTLDHLRKAAIKPVGAGPDEQSARTPVIVERKGLRIAFLGYMNVPRSAFGLLPRDMRALPDRAGVAWADPALIVEDVRRAKVVADIVIVLLHSGIEYATLPDPVQRAAAYAAIDGGAAVVIGAHPHVLQGVERYKGGFIAYSLGNFIFDMTVTDSAILHLWVGPEGVRKSVWEPVTIGAGGQPRPASPGPAARILRQLERLTADLSKK